MNPSDELLELLDGVKDYAHRGDWERNVPENSLTAIRRAVDKGLGLEIDVHLTADGDLVVFHDHTTKRMCKIDGIVELLTTAKLTSLHLNNTEETIPTFKDVLTSVGGKVPVLIELKCRNNQIKLCDTLITQLEGYNGKYMFIGFDEIATKYFKDKGYTVALSCFKPKKPTLDFVPDALLCHIWGVPLSKKKLEALPPFISWTINNNRERRKSEKTCIATIYNTKHFDF